MSKMRIIAHKIKLIQIFLYDINKYLLSLKMVSKKSYICNYDDC